MHELSIARSLLGSVNRHATHDVAIKCVHVRVGPLQAIEPDAMQWAWRAATVDTPYADAQLQLQMVEWQLRCDACGQRWESHDPLIACSCGNPTPQPIGDDELTLVSLEVEEGVSIQNSVTAK